MSPLPLQGIRILDFTRVLAGPFCSMMLADLGADVVKIESPNSGDETRAWGAPWVGNPQDRISAYFACVNRNKQSITLNLKNPHAQHIATQLASKSHIVIENFKLGQMAGFGLDYDSLSNKNPALVYCSITGFGQTGDYRDRPGYDFVLQAMTGLMAITGEKDGTPHKVGVAVADVFTALFACNAIQAALRYAEKTGIGQFIDMSLYDSQLVALVNVASNVLISGNDAGRYGNQHANIVPYQTFTASDGDFVVAVGNDRQFGAMCAVLGNPHMATDSHFATNPARLINRGELISILSGIFITQPVAHWVMSLLAVDVPAGEIYTVQQALNLPHTQQREMVVPMGIADAHMLASPMRLSHTPPAVYLPPPRLGEHTDQILRDELSLSAHEIADLRMRGII